MLGKQRISPGPGQESVWDYPRPPRLEDSSRHLQVWFGGVLIAETQRSKRVLETSHPPVYYFPPEDIRPDALILVPQSTSWCEWKGQARYYTVVGGEKQAPKAAWFYDEPTPAFQRIQHYVAFYPQLMDACYVDGELVQPQPGGFYGGWITADIVGPFKGAAGTWGW